MILRFLALLTIVFSASVMSGCSTRLTDFTLLSTKSIDLSRGPDFVRSERRVEGEDTKYIIIFFPTGIPNVKESVDKAIESTPSTVALVDGVLEHEFFYFPYIFGYETFRTRGTPLVDTKRTMKKLSDSSTVTR